LINLNYVVFDDTLPNLFVPFYKNAGMQARSAPPAVEKYGLELYGWKS
jgi:hypothetical protein